jgi:diguanylate cyclase (GGDEF)-like protein
MDVAVRLVQHAHADALLLDDGCVVVWASGRTVRAARRDGRDVIGRPVLDLVADGDRSRVQALLGAARTTGALLLDTLAAADGRVLEVALHELPGLGLLVETWDVTAREARERDLRERSLHDPLTGVANRLLLLDRLDWALTPRRHRPSAVGVLFLDLDGFKQVNDRWGHAVGDGVLTAAAARMQTVLRPAATLGRLGGDEFAVVCDEVGAPEDLRAVAQRLLTVLEAPVEVSGVRVVLRVSIGAAACGDGSADGTALLAAADAAMYDAKAAGGGQLRLRVLSGDD